MIEVGMNVKRLTRVVVHVLEHIRDRGLALGVDTTGKLAEQTNLLVVSEPLGGCHETLGADGSRDAVWRRSRSISITREYVRQGDACINSLTRHTGTGAFGIRACSPGP